MKRIATLLLTIAFLQGNAQYDFLVHKTYAERYQLLDSLFYSYLFWEQDSVAAFTQLNALKVAAATANDKTLYFESQLAGIQYKIHNKIYHYATGIDSFLGLERKVLLADIRERDILLLRIQYRISLQYYYHEVPGKALEHQMKYYNTLSDISASEYPPKKGYLAHIGCIYYSFEDYKPARKYLMQAEKLPRTYVHVDIDVYNTLGLLMRNTRQYDSALYFFEKALRIADEFDEKMWLSVMKGNIGITYYHQKQYQKAIPLLKDDIYNGIANNQAENITNSIIKLADIYYIHKQYDSSWRYCLMARHFTEIGWNTYKHLVPIYRMLGRLYIQDGNALLAYRYADSANEAMKILADKKRAMLITRVQRVVVEERHKKEMTLAAGKHKMTLQKRNNLIAILSLTTVIALLLLNRQLIRRRRLIAEKALADNKLESAQKRLEAFTHTLHEKNLLLEISSQEITRLQSRMDQDILTTNSTLERLQKSTILTDEEWDDFRELFGQVHSGYLYRLKQSIPDLTPAEIRLVVLTKLKFSYKEMSSILGVSAGTLRSLKSRLIKKLNMDEPSDFEGFVDNI